MDDRPENRIAGKLDWASYCMGFDDGCAHTEKKEPLIPADPIHFDEFEHLTAEDRKFFRELKIRI